jgi:general nucleoside transport system permease protein
VSRARRILRQAWQVASIPLLATVLAFIVAAGVVIVSSAFSSTGFDPFLPLAAYASLLVGAFGSGNGIVNTLVAAAPLILGGLAVGLGFKAGLFNIGVAGQFLVGAFAAAVVGSSLASAPTAIGMPLAILAGAVGGAAFGFIPGFLKARTGAHEVVTTIMLNNAAVLLLGWVLNDFARAPGFSFSRTAEIGNSALPILLGRNLHIGIPLAVLTVFAVRWLLDRTTIGFEIRTVGQNPSAARYAGMRPVFLTTLTMTLSGLLGGLAGSIQMLGVIGFYAPGITGSVGFDSIAVALLGRSDPIGILFAAMLFGAFRAGAPLMQIETSVPIEVIDIIQALVILFLAADLLVRRVFRIRAKTPAIPELATVTQTWAGGGSAGGPPP